MKHIILVEDDKVAQVLVAKALNNEYSITNCSSLAEAYEATKLRQYDLAIVDRGLTDGDGIEFCQFLRQHEKMSEIPIIFLSGMEAEADKVAALFAGADDYITKPFYPLELKARILARLRTQTPKLRVGAIEIDIRGFQAYSVIAGQKQELDLTRTEYKLLVTLAQAKDEVLSREALLTKVWGDALNVTDRVVDTHLSHLRKKIASLGVVIRSVHGEGYKILVQEKVAQEKMAA